MRIMRWIAKSLGKLLRSFNPDYETCPKCGTLSKMTFEYGRNSYHECRTCGEFRFYNYEEG